MWLFQISFDWIKTSTFQIIIHKYIDPLENNGCSVVGFERPRLFFEMLLQWSAVSGNLLLSLITFIAYLIFRHSFPHSIARLKTLIRALITFYKIKLYC